jgi:hypothetical protein
MKAREIQTGGHYKAKVNGRIVTVRVNRIEILDPHFSYNTLRPARERTRYLVTNLSTGRNTVFYSPAKFRCTLDEAAEIQRGIANLNAGRYYAEQEARKAVQHD